MYSITNATRKIANLRSRIRALPGGTSAGKTIGTLEVLIDLAQRDKTPTLTSVVSESFPHLRRGCIRDFLSIIKEQGYFKDSLWNATNFIYTFETGSQIEFFSADQPDKLRGARRNRLFVNEANNISFDAFEQLEVRTKDCIFLDWNPTTEFWYYTELKGKRDDVEECTLTYKDNEALDENIVASIEQRKDRKSWWTVYGLGQLGEVETRIYTGWLIVDDVPMEARLERYGIDFGYTNDPTAIVAVYYHNGAYILDEIIYQNQLTNKQIADIILNQNFKALTIADSAEPKSIDEIRGYGITILPSKKGQGSVNQGIQYVQQQKVFMTKRSLNIIKDYRNYVWITDKDGKIINEPDHLHSHSMDAIRYALASIKDPNQMNAHVHYSISAHPITPAPFQGITTQVGLPPELRDKPKTAYIHIPRL